MREAARRPGTRRASPRRSIASTRTSERADHFVERLPADRLSGGTVDHRVQTLRRRRPASRGVGCEKQQIRSPGLHQRNVRDLLRDAVDLAAALANDQRLARLAVHDAQDRDFAVAVDASTFPTARARIAATDELKRSTVRALDPPAPGPHRARYETRS